MICLWEMQMNWETTGAFSELIDTIWLSVNRLRFIFISWQ